MKGKQIKKEQVDVPDDDDDQVIIVEDGSFGNKKASCEIYT